MTNEQQAWVDKRIKEFQEALERKRPSPFKTHPFELSELFELIKPPPTKQDELNKGSTGPS